MSDIQDDLQGINQASAEAAKLIKSPLFQQIACMMTACMAAKLMVDMSQEQSEKHSKANTQPDRHELIELNNTLFNLAKHLAAIDFEHGKEIVAGALDACRLAQAGVDIVCSGFTVGMPQKSKNPDKKMFIKGGIAADKAAVIFLDKAGAENCIKALAACLDTLHPQRLLGMGATPELIRQ